MDELFRDLGMLYSWMDSIYKVECKKECNACCTQDNIWMLLPELVRINRIAKPNKVKTGCPYRTETGCSIYPYRPLVCRSYGSSKILNQNVRFITVPYQENERALFGPGICNDLLPSECNVDELNKIYTCYASLARWGWVSVGKCNDPILESIQTGIMFEMQKDITGYTVDAKDGIVSLSKEWKRFFDNYEFEGVKHD